jgi:hypothetical protein
MSSDRMGADEKDATIASLRVILKEDASDHTRALASHSAEKVQLKQEVASLRDMLRNEQESVQQIATQKNEALEAAKVAKMSMETELQDVSERWCRNVQPHAHTSPKTNEERGGDGLYLFLEWRV